MYIPSHFQINESNELHRIIVENPFGILVTMEKMLDANHIPFLFDATQGEKGVLTAHVARANPVWQNMADSDVLVIFRGVESYISPNWYPSKHETHRQVPTWNYEVVHAHGKLTIHDDEKFIRGVVGRLTKTHEAQEQKPWKMSDSPQEYMDMMMKAIVGIQVTITSIEGKAKLSQNREVRDRQGAISSLESIGKQEMATTMKKHV
jgi:transcriptional regulator